MRAHARQVPAFCGMGMCRTAIPFAFTPSFCEAKGVGRGYISRGSKPPPPPPMILGFLGLGLSLFGYKSVLKFLCTDFLLVLLQAPCRNLPVVVGHLWVPLMGLKGTPEECLAQEMGESKEKVCVPSIFSSDLGTPNRNYSSQQ